MTICKRNLFVKIQLIYQIQEKWSQKNINYVAGKIRNHWTAWSVQIFLQISICTCKPLSCHLFSCFIRLIWGIFGKIFLLFQMFYAIVAGKIWSMITFVTKDNFNYSFAIVVSLFLIPLGKCFNLQWGHMVWYNTAKTGSTRRVTL